MKKPIGIETRRQETVSHTVTIGKTGFLSLLRLRYPELLNDVPDESIAVDFRVPTGGDYSGVDVALDDEKQVLTIYWAVKS